ncbi:bacteriophytochrome [Oceanococcus atlanticus]|uniref:histidine kinase n=1 Tax=Oceanococcus atlanticus TaxID=1317117 RepID=A0A1Y1SEW7_9GAMM|nr:ATP-binding protein [Oceanococcus atlanticus]ORE87072.1 bacteriophytochrome [Oceanococcus atlanticus]
MGSQHIAAQKLQALEKELESFAYSVAHDLHAPLRAILHFSKMLERRAHDKLDTREQELLRQIPELAGKAQGMLDALLAYSRLGQPELHVEPLDMTELARSAGTRLQEQFPQANLALDIAAQLPAASGDKGLITRLLDELMTNAVQFNDQDTRKITVSFDQDEDAYCVDDNGIGMSPSGLERAGAVFCRLHAQGVYGDGLGMGLSMASKIARLHHGRLWLRSIPDQGTRVYFQLGAQHETQ